MLLEHRGKTPHVHSSAYIAPTATVCGDVSIGENSRVLFGATLVAEGGPVEIGANCIIMVFGLERAPAGETIMPEMTTHYARALARHFEDRLLDPPWTQDESRG